MSSTRIWIVVAATFLALLVPSVSTAQTTGLTLDRLKNATYPSGYSPSKQVTLLDGKVEWDQPPLRGNAVFVDAKIGTAFAAVLIGSSTGGSGSFLDLHLVTSSAGVPTAGPGVFIGDRTRVESIDIQGGTTLLPGDPGRVRLSLLTQGPTDPQCCPTQRETRRYDPDGNSFRLVSTDITQPGSGPLTPPPATGAPVGPITPPKTGNLGSADVLVADAVVASLALLAALAVGVARRATRFARR